MGLNFSRMNVYNYMIEPESSEPSGYCNITRATTWSVRIDNLDLNLEKIQRGDRRECLLNLYYSSRKCIWDVDKTNGMGESTGVLNKTAVGCVSL
jgi:hypothetical protein